jgi:hypothetical protein
MQISSSKQRTLIIIILILINAFLLPSLLCLAQGNPGDSLNQTRNAADLPTGAVPTYLGQIIGAGVALSGSLFLFLIIYGGFIIMTAAGNEDRVSKGKKVIYWAVIGILIIGASYGITTFIFNAISK